VRAYAAAVGLDPRQVLEAVAPALPQPEDPLDGLARVRGFARRRARAECSVSGAGVPGAGAPRGDVSGAGGPDVGVAHGGGPRRGVPRTGVRRSDMHGAGERHYPADFGAGQFDWRASTASAIDGALLTAVVLALAKLTAVAAGTDIADVIAPALPAWSLIAALIASTYFVLLGGVRNATLGTAAVRIRIDDGVPQPLDACSAVLRGLRCALRESSILIEWLLANGQSNGWLRVLTHRG
jgi:hypothetical protein